MLNVCEYTFWYRLFKVENATSLPFLSLSRYLIVDHHLRWFRHISLKFDAYSIICFLGRDIAAQIAFLGPRSSLIFLRLLNRYKNILTIYIIPHTFGKRRKRAVEYQRR